MRRAGAAALVALALGATVHTQASLPRPGTARPTVVLRLPTGVEPSAVTIVYSTGEGYGPLRTAPGVHDYVIDAVVNDRPAGLFKAWAYAPGFGFSLLSIDLTQGPASRTVVLRFAPLRTVTFNGRLIATADTPAFAGRQVQALYNPAFTCDFFMGTQWMDCLTGPIVMGAASIADDGRFTVELPDLANDSALAGFRHKGSFSFRVMEGPGRPAFSLNLEPSVPATGLSSGVMAATEVAVAPQYGTVASFSVNRVQLAIARAQGVSASELSPALPRVPLGEWLRGLFGAALWSIDDCGEQAGNPALDAGRDFPRCVTAQMRLQDGRSLLVSILVGTTQRGVTGTPAFWGGDLINPRGESRRFSGLAEIVEFARTLPGRSSAQ